MENTRTCEFVSPKHPDKLCDYIADSILDAYLGKDPESRVAIEVSGGHNLIIINGETRSRVKINVESITKNIVGERYRILVNIAEQSPFIAKGVDLGGAGDQGVMIGYATSENNAFVPKEYELARKLCQEIYKLYPFDGKVQITLKNDLISCVVASFQNSKSEELENLVRSLIKAGRYCINPAGEWATGGFDADSGLSGRKLVIDNYGPRVAIGGGSFSGKDYTKVDRSAAYMARKIAVDLLLENAAEEVLVKLAYAIGIANPIMAVACIDGKETDISKKYPLTPSSIADSLNLKTARYAKMSQWGHFGQGYEWDKPFTKNELSDGGRDKRSWTPLATQAKWRAYEHQPGKAGFRAGLQESQAQAPSPGQELQVLPGKEASVPAGDQRG